MSAPVIIGNPKYFETACRRIEAAVRERKAA